MDEFLHRSDFYCDRPTFHLRLQRLYFHVPVIVSGGTLEVNKMGIQGKRVRSEKDRVRKRKKVCYVCGDRGFSQLLVNCSECSDLAIHWYCLGIVPGSEDNTNVVNWVCESCCALTESKPCETALAEDQSEVLQKLPPKSLPEILEQEEWKNQLQHSGETFVPMTVSYQEVVLSPFIERPEEISQGLVLIASSSGEITIHESREPEFCHFGELVYKDEENEDKYSIEDIIEHPEAISNELVLIASPSGEITIHESGKLDFSYAGELVYEVGENGQEYSIEDTMELDFGAEEQIDSGFLSETVELAFGTDEENDVCYPDKPPTMLDFVVQDEVHQGIKPPKVNVGIQPVSTNFQPEILSLPVPKHTVQQSLSENESQSSKAHDSPEMSIPASVLDMANGFLESTLERIDVNVGPYRIRSDLALILRNLLSKYGDIFHDCVVEPDIFLVTICQAIQYLQTIPFKNLRQQHIDYIRDTLKFPDACAVNVEWLEKHCDYLEEVVHQTVNYIALKEEWDETARNVRLKKKLVDSSGSKQELRLMEDETGEEEGHLRELEDNMKSIKSLWRRISRKSLVDGLF